MFHLEQELFRLQHELENGDYQPGPYHTFTIREPKERQIAAAPFRDRVVHHAVCAALEPVFERRYIHDSYACRKDKGSHRALQRAWSFTRQGGWFLKCDVAMYFDSVDHDVLKTLVRGLFKDARFLALLERIIDHNAPHNMPGKGLPIGNLTSQLFANFYLSGFDHFVREQLHLPGYIRYMDDILIFNREREKLCHARKDIYAKLKELRLHVNPRKDCVQSNKQGVEFLGFRIIHNTIRLRSQNLARFKRKMLAKSQDHGVELPILLRSFNGHLGYLKGGHTKKITNHILNDIEFQNDRKRWKLVV